MTEEKTNLEDKTIKPGFEAASSTSGAPLPEATVSAPTDTPTPPQGTKGAFGAAADQRRVVRRTDGRTSGPTGRTPHGVLTDKPQITFGDAIAKFIHLLSLLLAGKTEQFNLEFNGPAGFRERYIDPVERDDPSVKKLTKPEREAIRRMDDTLRQARVLIDPNSPRIQRLDQMAGLPGVQQLLTVIKKRESKNTDAAYDMVNGSSSPKINGKPLTECTITEVMNAQKSGGPYQWGGRSSAAGAYQIIPGTLKASVERLGIDPDKTLFNKRTQDLLAMDLLEKGGLSTLITTGENMTTFMKNIAKTWSSLPLDSSGKANYGTVENNPDRVSQSVVTEVMSALTNIAPKPGG